MSEKNELVPSHPWFLELSEALGTNFETISRMAIGQLLNKSGPQAIANILGPYTPSLLDGILDPAQIQEISGCTPAQPVDAENAIGYFIKIMRGVALLYAKQSGQEPPSDELFSALQDTVESAIPTHTGTELVTIREQPQTTEVATSSREEELKNSSAYYGVAEAVLQSENLEIEERNGVQGVEIEADNEMHFIPLRDLWTLIDYSQVTVNGIRKPQFEADFRNKKITNETAQQMELADTEEKKQKLKEQYIDYILDIRREQIRGEVEKLHQVQPRLDEERPKIEALNLTELRAKVIELYTTKATENEVEMEQVHQAYQIASERLQFHQVVDRVIGSVHYDDMVVGIQNAQNRTERIINNNLLPEQNPIDVGERQPIPVFAEMQPVIDQYYQAICEVLYRNIIITNYPSTPEQLSRVKVIFQRVLEDYFFGLENALVDETNERFVKAPNLNKVGIAYGQLTRQMLIGIKDYTQIKTLVSHIIDGQLQILVDKTQKIGKAAVITCRSRDGQKITELATELDACTKLVSAQLVDDLLEATTYAQAIGNSLPENTLSQSAKVWEDHWQQALNLPTASPRGIDADTAFSEQFRPLSQTRKDIVKVYQQAEEDLPEIREKREIRLKVEATRRQIVAAREKIETLVVKVEELEAEARKRLNEARQSFAQAEKRQQSTPEKRSWTGKVTNGNELQQIHDEYMQAEGAVKNAELNLKLVSEGRGVAAGLIERISALREQIGRAQEEIQKLNFPPTPSLDIDFEPKKDAQGQPTDITPLF